MFDPISLSSKKPVCGKNCPNRSWDCHKHCQKYKDYRAECDKEMQQRNDENKLRREVNDAVSKAVKRLPGKRRY